ncbi:MAG TPA: hypothetical protein VFS92_00640, partial [Planctomycetota bacterium]|nr:hypothetical protein [Planctomycetota bacterium]
VRFAAWIAAEPKARLAKAAAGFRGVDFCPDPAGQPEGLDAVAFAKEFGSTTDERFKKKVAALREAVEGLAAYEVAKAK